MVREDADALTCDLAQVYHVFDWRALPLRTAAILAAGLPEDSRIMRRFHGMPTEETTILATIADGVRGIQWLLTKDGLEGVNHPESILAILTGRNEPDEAYGFDSAEAYEEARARIIAGSE